MKAMPVSRQRAEAQRALSALGPIIEGSLCTVRRGDAVRWQLTDRPAGKTRTLYVPAGRAEEVREWTDNWKQTKRLLQALSEASRQELREAAVRGGDTPRPRPRAARSSRS